jgi:uncharacterized membrane protein HdeD (DUF308 family)
MLALQGAAALLFGILALAWPGATLVLLVALFAAYAIVSGIAGLIGAKRRVSVPRPDGTRPCRRRSVN